MNRLACLTILVAMAVPCAASDPARVSGRQAPRHHWDVGALPTWGLPPAPLVSNDLLRTILLPTPDLGRWVMGQLGIGPTADFTGNLIGLQVPGVLARVGQIIITGNAIHRD